MKNRVADYLSAPNSFVAPPAMPDPPQQLGVNCMRRVTASIQSHPEIVISAAFCIGILLGWAIKRK